MKLKKIISLITSTALAISFASSSTANALENATQNIVYVEGHGFKVTTSLEGDTIVQSLENTSKLVMDQDGNADIVLENQDGTIENYDVKIKNLSEENVDIILTQSGKIVDEIVSYDDIVEDSYVGQVAVAGVLITADLILTALAIAAITVVIAGVTCYAIDAIEKQIKKNKNYIYYAYLCSGNVFINPVSISDKTAIAHIKVTGDSGGVYTFYKDNAASLAKRSTSKWCGPENHFSIAKMLLGNIYYDHYHNCVSGAHIWYGMPQNRKLTCNNRP